MTNRTEHLRCLWVEPWGTDHWMRPGEEFTVVAEPAPEESPFDVVLHRQDVTVMVNEAYSSTVVDQDGAPVPCGHQRPADR
ncbi:hypothetical protein [Kitasatospora sp. NPDC101183]|uniref:hypothetical protein n=1 Tax=Kitasatospora sp. NPDC101183 TaxID=3364100 RepID=UPI0038249185